jgi:hypothetical protein
MAGGNLNLISVGNANVILTGDPTKTFFKATYCKYTNFGLQKFRLDYQGSRDLRLSEDSTFTFYVERNADLLMDTYVVVNLPDIWSPIYSPSPETNYKWVGYDFRWIQNIGIQMIRNIEITCGSTLIQRYSGEYLAAMVERDFTSEKKDLFNKMSGNVEEINDPANAFGRSNAYPNAFYTPSSTGAEPSIRGRSLYIPINTWFTLDSRCAFPLISLQYNKLAITVTIRPIQELFQVRDIYDTENQYPYIAPDFIKEAYQMYRFLQTPPSVRIDNETQNSGLAYQNLTKIWNADIHILATYCFLDKEERNKFAKEDQIYLVKDVFQYNFDNITGSSHVKMENSSGMVSSWMWYLQRNDVKMRNEWSNYTNWPYNNLPSNIQLAPDTIPTASSNSININYGITDASMILLYGPSYNPDSENNITNTGLYISGGFTTDNHKEILETMGILFGGIYRENIMERGIYDYIEKYVRTRGSAKEGLYCYNFCLDTSPFEYQPNGAINLSKFKNIVLELTTFIPQIDPDLATFSILCDETGFPVAVSNKPSWQLYQYNYNMTLFEERYNILSFISGNCGMLYAR